MINQKKTKKITQRIRFFYEAPENLAPPPAQPSQATWVRMMTMLTEFNQMMEKMKQKNAFMNQQ